MKKIAILIFVIYIVSCSKDNVFEQSSGTKLIFIEYLDDNESWTQKYSYSSNNKLIKIEDFRSLGKIYELDYQGSRLNEYSTYQTDGKKLIFRDSILYNSNGTIQAIYNFSISSEGNLPLSWIYDYEYDNENKVYKRSTFFVKIQEYTSVEKYYWHGNNIEKVEHYNGDEELYHESFYEYDDKINYKKEIPTSVSDPINWSENNITEISFKDYSGLLDLSCSPCITEYKYNLDNYPVLIKFNWGRQIKLKYE